MGGVSVRVVQAIVAGAGARGVLRGELLRAAGIDEADLADPDGRLPRAVEARIWDEAARLSGDECFGLHLAEMARLDGACALGVAVESSTTAGEAFDRVASYLNLLTRSLVLEIHAEGAIARIAHPSPLSRCGESRHAVELLLAGVLVLGERIAGAPFVPRAASFRHPAPDRTDEHRRRFGPAVAFGAASDELILDRALLSKPRPDLLGPCPAPIDLLPAAITAPPAPGGSLDQVRSAIAREIARGEPSLAAIAVRLGVSPRTLQRRLQAEGASLQDLLGSLRADLARVHLAEPREAIAEISFRLGFVDLGTFHRAFQRWTGVTPSAYRRARIKARS